MVYQYQKRFQNIPNMRWLFGIWVCFFIFNYMVIVFVSLKTNAQMDNLPCLHTALF